MKLGLQLSMSPPAVVPTLRPDSILCPPLRLWFNQHYLSLQTIYIISDSFQLLFSWFNSALNCLFSDLVGFRTSLGFCPRLKAIPPRLRFCCRRCLRMKVLLLCGSVFLVWPLMGVRNIFRVWSPGETCGPSEAFILVWEMNMSHTILSILFENDDLLYQMTICWWKRLEWRKYQNRIFLTFARISLWDFPWIPHGKQHTF